MYVRGNGFGDYGDGPEFDGHFGGLFSGLKKAVKKTVNAVGSAVSATSRAVSSVTKHVDPTYSKSLIGRIPVAGKTITSLSRQAVATAASVQTAGLSVLAGEKGVISKSTFGVKPTAQGAMTGAAVGAAILGGQSALAAGAAGLKGATPVAAPAVSEPIIDTASAPSTMAPGQPAARGGALGPVAGAGAGFLVGGPVGAVVGAAAGYLFTRPKAGG